MLKLIVSYVIIEKVLSVVTVQIKKKVLEKLIKKWNKKLFMKIV